MAGFVGIRKQTSNSTGEVFYQGKLDDPSLPEPLPIMLFGDPEEGYRVAWNRPVSRRENLDGTRGKARRQRAADDGFGDGNATESGQLVGEDDGDDRMPAFA